MRKIVKMNKQMKRILNQNDKIITRGEKHFYKWKHKYTIEEYLNAVAYEYNSKIKDIELYF